MMNDETEITSLITIVEKFYFNSFHNVEVRRPFTYKKSCGDKWVDSGYVFYLTVQKGSFKRKIIIETMYVF